MLLGFRLVGGGDTGAVWTVLIDDGHAQVLRRLLESVLRVGGDVLHGVGAEESAVGLRAEGVLQIAILQDVVRDGGGDPEKLLLLVDLVGEGHRMRRGVHAGEDVHLLGVEQPLRLVDRDFGLGLAVAVDLDDLVLAEHAALFVDVIDDHLGAAPAVEGAGGREGPGVIEQDADLDRLPLRVGARSPCARHGRRQRERHGEDHSG